jgi:4-amino-4-deoxy-L-arabinose transferase-like glycosyltransferase
MALWRRNPATMAALAIAALVLVRLAIIIASPLEIGPDEAQYWRWSRTLDFGYYSKPPLIAWVISLSTAVFGDGEWAIRFFAPVLHGVAAFFLFLLGRQAFDARVGGWSAAIYMLMPGVWLSSAIITTDAVLLSAWSAGLYFLWRLREKPTLANGALAGAALGLAMLAKYAALYLFSGAALAAVFDRDMRKALLSPGGAAMLVVSLAVMSPNLIWNAMNEFATLSHTADNANLAEAGFSPLNVIGFIGDQMAVFGPLTFLLFIAGCFFVIGRKDPAATTREVWLLGFIVPALTVIMGQEIMSRAHANWAAAAYPAASVLLASWVDRAFGKRTGNLPMGPLVWAGAGLNAVIGIVFAVVWLAPSIGDAVGGANAFKRVRGWEQTSAELGAKAQELGATALMFDEREIWHGVDYYGRNMTLPPVRAWRRGDHPRSHAEEAGTMLPGEDARVLVASYVPDFQPRIRADFASMEPVGALIVPLGPRRQRVLQLYLASGYHPLPRTPEYEAAYRN